VPPQVPSPYLQQLEIIDSPVPDFAATLTTRDEHSDDNMSYLRTRLPQLPETPDPTLTRSERTRQSYLTENEFRNFTSESRRRMLRNFDTSRRTPETTAEQQDETSGTNYANRIPQRQSLYDWAPAAEDDEENEDWDPPSYRFDVLNRSREHLPLQEQNHFRSIQRSIDAQRAARSRPRREPRDEPSGRTSVPYWAESLRNNSSSPRSEQSLSATAALLQSVERHRRYNARARQTMQGFILDRDRLNHEGATPQLTSSRLHRSDNARGTSPYSHYLAHSPSSSRDLRAAYRQMFLDNPSLTHLKHMIKYLSDLRHCTTIEECEALAADLDFDTLYETIKPYRDTDFIMNLTVLKPPQPSSWLMPGTVFSGSQHSPQESSALMLHRDREHLRRQVASHQAASGRWDYSDSMPTSLRQLADAERYVSSLSSSHHSIPASSASSNNTVSSNRTLDRWPVRVVLHSIDLDNMTVSGTMSASHIPDKLSPTSPDHKPDGSSMNSFFEGEIIDFRKHSLETENFRSDGLETDVTYWRNIGPFRELSRKIERATGAEEGEAEEEMARCLASHDWLENVLARNWVLMRWKGEQITHTCPANHTRLIGRLSRTVFHRSIGLGLGPDDQRLLLYCHEARHGPDRGPVL
jgi:hypothetical protein